jgi:hypothetical protein
MWLLLWVQHDKFWVLCLLIFCHRSFFSGLFWRVSWEITFYLVMLLLNSSLGLIREHWVLEACYSHILGDASGLRYWGFAALHAAFCSHLLDCECSGNFVEWGCPLHSKCSWRKWAELCGDELPVTPCMVWRVITSWHWGRYVLIAYGGLSP